MKFLFFIPLLLLPYFITIAQENKKDSLQFSLNKSGDIIVEISPNISYNNIAGSRFAGGMNIEYFISRRLNFNGYLVIGKDYGHMNLAIITLPIYFILGSSSTYEISSFENFLFDMFWYVSIFENPSIHFPVSASSDFSLNVSLLRMKWDNVSKVSTQYGQFQFAFASGLRYNKYFGRFVLSPYGEFCVGYIDFTPEINAGVHFGLYIPKK